MRRAGAFAALALLALALGTASCKPSSLTPFGIGTKEPESFGGGVNGLWSGVTNAGQSITFQVASGTVVNLVLTHSWGNGCSRIFDTTGQAALVENNAFHLDVPFTQGELIVDGVFTSDTTSNGSYFFEGLSVIGSCPTSGSGTFVATKAF